MTADDPAAALARAMEPFGEYDMAALDAAPKLLAALRVLAQYWSDDESTATALKLAAASDDNEIRNAGRRRGGKG